MSKEILQDIINEFSPGKFIRFFRDKNRQFKPSSEELNQYNDQDFKSGIRLGDIKFSQTEQVIVCAFESKRSLSERSSKKAQYDKGKKVLKETLSDAGIFIFYDKAGNFRLSLIYANYLGKKRDWSLFRRFTYFVSKEYANKTFLIQLGGGDFSSLDKVKDVFSIAKVTNEFYEEFNENFGELCAAVKIASGSRIESESRDFALLFAIRLIFLGFIQKRRWLGEDDKFLQCFLLEYRNKSKVKNDFYTRWLRPLFFEALNTPPGHKVALGSNDFTPNLEKALQMAPYLNGGLFQEHELDQKGYFIPDEPVMKFFDFLFSYNFTIEENTLYDEELELNPEFLGIIFERLVNKENGAVYTPRTEVDFMCRMALVKWLEKSHLTKIALKDLYEMLFLEGGPDASESHQRRGDFTAEQKKELIDLLSSVTICDPAVGSGAFLVGMLHVLDEVEQNLRSRVRDPDYKLDAFQRKERIIARSLYGVEVKQWAVWITQLRLWITLFIDAPEDMRFSQKPILPSLDFKVRQGDSLVQRIGKKMFPVSGHANISSSVKAKITKLKELKNDYYQNKTHDPKLVRQAEYRVFLDILNSEMDAKRGELRTLGDSPKQMDFLGESGDSEKNKELFQERIKKLKSEISDLADEQNALREERPLVWNIEFSEIFFERGGFDIIIGNPPYVRQEDIADPLGKIKNAKDYKNALTEMVYGDFLREFKKEKINAQSDLYTYFYIRSLRLLNEKGIHVFICSNSWLDVGYGAWLQKFLLSYAPIHFIFDNHSKRSFAAADVNTIISVIGAPAKKVADDHMVKFAAFKQPFEEVIYTENLLEIERARAVEANEKFRVYPITNNDLFRNGLEMDSDGARVVDVGRYVGEKWGGKFLHAPDIFFEILKRGEKHIKVFRSFFDGERYLNTGGADGFFILTDVKWSERYANVFNDRSLPVRGDDPFEGEIEASYLKPLIKEIDKEDKTIELSKADAWCLVLKDPDKNHKVFKYIKWGERQGYHERSVTINQRPWYKPTVQMMSGGEILLPRSFNDTFVVYYNPKRLLSLRFYRLHLKSGEPKLFAAFLNSTLFWFFYETLGQKNLGGGALDFFMEDFLNMKIPIILDKKMLVLFNNMKSRQIRSIFEECGVDVTADIREQDPRPLPDRKKLDDIIFDAIGLTTTERKEVYWSVCELVKKRLDKARSV